MLDDIKMDFNYRREVVDVFMWLRIGNGNGQI
jgi:hypothetical protein